MNFKTEAILFKEDSFNANKNSLRLFFVKRTDKNDFIRIDPQNVNFLSLERES